MIVSLRPGMVKDRDEVLRELIDIQYNRNDMDIQRATFRVTGRCGGSISGTGRRLSHP